MATVVRRAPPLEPRAAGQGRRTNEPLGPPEGREERRVTDSERRHRGMKPIASVSPAVTDRISTGVSRA